MQRLVGIAAGCDNVRPDLAETEICFYSAEFESGHKQTSSATSLYIQTLFKLTLYPPFISLVTTFKTSQNVFGYNKLPLLMFYPIAPRFYPIAPRFLNNRNDLVFFTFTFME